MQSHRLVIVDTLGKVLPPGIRTDDYVSMVDLLGPLQEAALEYHCCLLLIGHNRKNVSDDAIDNPVSSIGIVSTMDTIWQLSKRPQTKETVLQMGGRDIEARELFVSWDASVCSWNLAGSDAGKIRPDSELERVAMSVKVLGYANSGTIATHAGVKPGNASRALGQLEVMGTVKLEPRGKEHWYRYTSV
jgi:hypothetical protein